QEPQSALRDGGAFPVDRSRRAGPPASHDVALPPGSFLRWERLEGLEDPEVGAGKHGSGGHYRSAPRAPRPALEDERRSLVQSRREERIRYHSGRPGSGIGRSGGSLAAIDGEGDSAYGALTWAYSTAWAASSKRSSSSTIRRHDCAPSWPSTPLRLVRRWAERAFIPTGRNRMPWTTSSVWPGG